MEKRKPEQNADPPVTLEILQNGDVEGQNATHHTTPYNFTF
jgi:hypothetical protein